jgi:AcrR family transcriptional regulator
MDAPKKLRLTREDWVEAATQLLIKKSIDAVRVEPLAKQLNVSRGSFYWHFKSRQEVLQSILTLWRERQTRRIMERIRDDRLLSPEEQLRKLRMTPHNTKTAKEAAALELAIRAWARRDPFARQAVQAVDQERVGFTEELFLQAGHSKGDARTWALMGHAYILGESLLRESMTDDEIAASRSKLLDAQFASLKPPPTRG